jgi:anti-sigma regulatory factor (Ser/Thr protein kinase)
VSGPDLAATVGEGLWEMSCHHVLSARGRSPGVNRSAKHLHLDPDLRSVATAREFVRERLDGCVKPTVDDACWLTSELVANAVLHADTDLVVGVTADTSEILVTVTDRRHDRVPRLGRMPTAEDVVEMSRGIAIVCAVATDFGWKLLPGSNGKVVWFTLSLG